MTPQKISKLLCFLLDDGEVVFPCTLQNKITREHTFRVSRYGGNILNDPDPKKREEEATEQEMCKLVLELGYSTRVLRKNGQMNIFSPNSGRVVQVYVART